MSVLLILSDVSYYLFMTHSDYILYIMIIDIMSFSYCDIYRHIGI